MIRVEVDGANAVVLKIGHIEEAAHGRLLARYYGLTAALESRVRGAAPVRTGRLRSEIKGAVSDSNRRITGSVSVKARGPEYGKAAALEYGAHGTTSVKAHEEALTHIFSRFVAPVEVMVARHQRRLNIGEVDYLHGPFDSMREEIIDETAAAVGEAIETA